MKEIKKIFPGLYIATQEGELIYEPHKEKDKTSTEEKGEDTLPIAYSFGEGVKNIVTGERATNVQGLQIELAENYKGKEAPTQNKGVAK